MATTVTTKVHECAQEARQLMSEGRIGKAASVLNEGLMHVRCIEDLHELLDASSPYLLLVEDAEYGFPDDVLVEDAGDEFYVTFYNPCSSYSVWCKPDELWTMARFEEWGI